MIASLRNLAMFFVIVAGAAGAAIALNLLFGYLSFAPELWAYAHFVLPRENAYVGLLAATLMVLSLIRVGQLRVRAQTTPTYAQRHEDDEQFMNDIETSLKGEES